ncbi:MAG: hypothetical protein KKA19_00700 [Candidatus Margulisbacteria bacterium]|nr:hypothetical protein [Candidatus Margulisiibacteriota bacterium]
MEPINEIINNQSLLVDQLNPARTGSLSNAKATWRQVFMSALNALDQDTLEDTEEIYAPKYPRRIHIQQPSGSITSTMIDDAFTAGLLSTEKAQQLRVQLG